MNRKELKTNVRYAWFTVFVVMFAFFTGLLLKEPFPIFMGWTFGLLYLLTFLFKQ